MPCATIVGERALHPNKSLRLHDGCRKKGQIMDEEQAWIWLVQLLLALQFCHSNKILHRWQFGAVLVSIKPCKMGLHRPDVPSPECLLARPIAVCISACGPAIQLLLPSHVMQWAGIHSLSITDVFLACAGMSRRKTSSCPATTGHCWVTLVSGLTLVLFEQLGHRLKVLGWPLALACG